MLSYKHYKNFEIGDVWSLCNQYGNSSLDFAKSCMYIKIKSVWNAA